jgi:TolB-like protein/Tfp pilus assembly protein PilF
MMGHEVFISYATKDKSVANDVCAALEARGLRCWMAPRDVVPGTPYGQAIIEAIQGSRVMVVVFSANANASVHIPNEVERALSNGVTIIPLRIENVLPGKSLDYFLGPLHWLDALDAPLERHWQTLAEVVEKTLSSASAAGPSAVQVNTAPQVSRTSASVPVKQKWWRNKTAIGIAAVVLLAVIAGAGWVYRSRMSGGESIDSVAVLPFANGSGDLNMEYLSDGITESLINSLSTLPHLKVMSRDSAFMYKGKDTDPRIVGQKLGVRAVLKGRVMQRGDDLEISAELVDARDDSNIWGQRYSRKASDIFALQVDLAKEMTSMLRMRLTGEDEKRMDKIYTTNPEAYQDYLKGRYWWNKTTPEGFNKGIEYFRQAIAKDPNYALAYTGLADCYGSLAGFGILPSNDALPKGKEAALKALEMDDTLAEAHSSLAWIKSIYEWDWRGGDKEFQRAIELNPTYVTAHRRRGLVLAVTGRFEEAIAENKRAVELDPLSLINNWALGDTLYHARQYDQAIEQERKTLEVEPNFVPALNALGLAYVEKSMFKEGEAALEQARTLAPGDTESLARLGYAYAVAGRRADAERVLDQRNQLSKRVYASPLGTALIYVGLGEKENALESLRKAVDEREVNPEIVVPPIRDSLGSDPRFADLLRRINLTP